MLEIIASGQAAFGVVGTHAVIQEQVLNLALAVIDEQQLFGVAQRLACCGKIRSSAGWSLHLLMVMSAYTHSAHPGHELLRRFDVSGD